MDPATLRKDGSADLLPPSRLAPQPADPRPVLLVLAPTHRGSPPFSARQDALAGLAALERISAQHGVVPTYALDHALAADGRQLEPLINLCGSGRAELAAHLVPALTPPLDGTPAPLMPGNLKRELEREKLGVLLERIAGRLGSRPTVLVAARAGVGKSSPGLFTEAGIRVDASLTPGFDLRAEGGADLRAFPASPYFYPAVPELLGVPQTGALLSPASARVESLAAAARLVGLERPVAFDVGAGSAARNLRLVDVLLARGVRVFTLVARVEDFTGPRGSQSAATFAAVLVRMLGALGARASTHAGLWSEIGRLPEVDGPYAKSRRARV